MIDMGEVLWSCEEIVLLCVTHLSSSVSDLADANEFSGSD